jgi:hypothetical protein
MDNEQLNKYQKMAEENYVYRDYAPKGKLSPEALEMIRRNVDVTLKKPDRFPAKLSEILARKDFAHIIAWQPHGRSFKVLDKFQMEQVVLPMYFETTNYNSFVRLLNAWQFRRIRKRGQVIGKTDQAAKGAEEDDYNSYYHDLFLRGHPGLTNSMRRLQRHNDRKIPMNPEDEPDFTVLGPLPIVLKDGDARKAAEEEETSAPEHKPLKKRALALVHNDEAAEDAHSSQKNFRDHAWKRHKKTDDAAVAVVTPAECHGTRSSPLNVDALKKVGGLPLSSLPSTSLDEFRASLAVDRVQASLAANRIQSSLTRSNNVIPEFVRDRLMEVSGMQPRLYPQDRGLVEGIDAALDARAYYHHLLLSGALQRASIDLAAKRTGLPANGFLDTGPGLFASQTRQTGYSDPRFQPREEERRLALLLSLMNRQPSYIA